MKKTLACLMCVCMLCVLAGSALAAAPITDYTLEEKLQLQLVKSGFRGEVALSLDGDGAFGITGDSWALWKAALEGMTLSVESTPSGDDRETGLTLKKGDAVLGSATLLSNGAGYAVQSDLINKNNVWYAFGKQFDLLGLAETDEEWPSPWHMLLAVYGADDAWKERALEAYAPYQTKLAVWMQSYLTVAQGGEGDDYVTRMSGEIPVSEVVPQIKQLLVDLYRDDAMLSLLREVFSARESAAYLNPAMETTYFAMLDQLSWTGSVGIDRRYDAAGTVIMDRVTLPFGENDRLQSLTVATGSAGLEVSFVTGDGRSSALTAVPGAENAWTGHVTAELPARQADFTVGGGAEKAESPVLSCDFTYSVDDTDEDYDLSQDLCSKVYARTLVLKPDGNNTADTGALSLTWRCEMTSKSARRAATHLSGEVTCTDQTAGGSVTLTFTGATAQPWTPQTISGLGQTPMQLDGLNEGALKTLTESWRSVLDAFGASLTPASGN